MALLADEGAQDANASGPIYASVVCIVSLSIRCLSGFSLEVLRSKGVIYAPLPCRLFQEQKDVLKTRLADSHALRGHHPILRWSPAPLSHTQAVTINSQPRITFVISSRYYSSTTAALGR
jgi:hypothetical protein